MPAKVKVDAAVDQLCDDAFKNKVALVKAMLQVTAAPPPSDGAVRCSRWAEIGFKVAKRGAAKLNFGIEVDFPVKAFSTFCSVGLGLSVTWS